MANYVRRNTRRMPSMKRHSLSALLMLALVFLAGYSWVTFKNGSSEPYAAVESEIILPEIIQPELQPAAAPLPDLLAPDNIPLDANPTELIDLLGAPAPQSNTSTGPRPPNQTDTAMIANLPKTILIDGSPIPGSNRIVNRATPLVRAPIQGLSRTSPFGAVPKIATDGRRVFTSYARPFVPASDKTYVSLVVGGLGVNQVITRRAINELPGEVTLSFAAETPSLQMWIHQARNRGHEVLIELPMESDGYNPTDPGATYTLMSSGPDSANIRNLDYLMSRAEGYFAVTNYGGDRLVNQDNPMDPILAHLAAAGLGMLYDGSTPAPQLNSLGKTKNLTTVTAQTLLDENIQNRSAVRAMVSSLQTGQTTKVPIGMGFSYPSTIDGIKDWLQSKPSNIGLAPVSFAMIQNQ